MIRLLCWVRTLSTAGSDSPHRALIWNRWCESLRVFEKISVVQQPGAQQAGGFAASLADPRL